MAKQLTTVLGIRVEKGSLIVGVKGNGVLQGFCQESPGRGFLGVWASRPCEEPELKPRSSGEHSLNTPLCATWDTIFTTLKPYTYVHKYIVYVYIYNITCIVVK